MSIDVSREYAIQERLNLLQEIADRRNELLRELFGLVKRVGNANALNLTDEEPAMEEDDEEIGRFLERFDLTKNPESGSILNYEIPEVSFETSPYPSEQPSPSHSVHLDAEETVDEPEETEELEEQQGQEQAQEQAEGTDEEAAKEAAEDEAVETEPEAEVLDVSGVEAALKETTSPVLETPGSPLSSRLNRPRNELQEADEDRMEIDEETPEISSPSKSEHSEEGEEEEAASEEVAMQEDGGSSHEEPIVQKHSTATPAQDEDEDELDIISLVSSSSRHPAKLKKEEDVQEETLSEVPSPREESIEVNHAEMEAEGSQDADDEDETPEQEISPDSTSPQQVLAEPEVVKDESPSPSPSSPSPKTPPPPSPPLKAPASLRNMPASPLPPPKPAPPPVIVRLNAVEDEIHPSYAFSEDLPPSKPPPTPSPMNSKSKKAIQYALPPLSALPAEFNRKGKTSKSRKRDKDREKSGSDSGKKDDWTPLGMAKWSALLHTNPVHKRVARAAKCVTTQNWNTAMTEIKLVRVFDRIELLKDAGRWSFRQPKKQRGAGGVNKTHWDYLLDEMKWLQVDFREERRWKLALAFELSLSVLEWHEAGSYEERLRLGIISKWRRPDPIEVDHDTNAQETVDILDMDEPETLTIDGPENQISSVQADDVDSEDEEREIERREQQIIDDALNPESVVAAAIEDANQPASDLNVSGDTPAMAPKLEEIENTDALYAVGPSAEQTGMDVDSAEPSHSNEVNSHPKAENVEQTETSALKDQSKNPNLGTQLDSGTANGSTSKGPTISSERMKEARAKLLSLPMDALIVSLDDLALFEETSNSEQSEENVVSEERPEFQLSSLFPELQTYGFFEAPNIDSVNVFGEGRKKSDKKGDKDDPTKRMDESTYTKLYPTGIFMQKKPTLISALQPAKKWRKGKWINLDESPVVSDVDGPAPLVSEDSTCALFEGRRQGPVIPSTHLFMGSTQAKRRTAEIQWSPAEDNVLKDLTDRYPNNWRLIADVMNSSRLRTRADMRTPQECLERWKARWLPGARASLAPNSSGSFGSLEEVGAGFGASPFSAFALDSASSPPPPTPTGGSSASQMTTRGVKRQATSAAQNTANLSVNTMNPNTIEGRKRRRHFMVNDSMRKASKRRDAMMRASLNAKKQTGPIHDTHFQYGNKTKYTPQELSRLKHEKDELARRQEEARRMQAREQMIRMQQLQQQQQQQQQLNATQQQAAAAASQAGPQIRSTQVNISQQHQRLPVQAGTTQPLSPSTLRTLAQAQAQAQAQNQVQNQAQAGAVQTLLSAQFGNRGGATSPTGAVHSSPPRSTATPSNGTPNLRPSSAQRNVALTGAPGAHPLPGSSVSLTGNPIARQNPSLATYFANTGDQQMQQLLRYQLVQQHQQQQQQQQQANQQVPLPQQPHQNP